MKFTYYTIIGRRPDMLREHVRLIKGHAGFDKMTCDKEILIIIYRNERIAPATTEECVSICEENDCKYFVYDEPHNDWLANLYRTFNLGYEKMTGGGLNFRSGSDQVFSKDSFPKMYDLYMGLKDKKVVIQANTIEYTGRNVCSRHFLKDFGENYDSFDIEAFENFCTATNLGVKEELLTWEEAMGYWNKPSPAFRSSLGVINRTDGCSWLMTKDDFDNYGPLPPIENGVTGDVIIHDRMQKAGFKNYIMRDCITYHFLRGESHEFRKQ